MSSRARLGFVSLALVLLGVLAIPRPCWARVVASVTRIEVASDGRARVLHTLRVEPSSGVLPTLVLQGVDSDAAPLPDAHVTALDAAGTAGAALPLELRIQDSRAELKVPRRKALRGDRFVIEFGYQTQLLRRGLIRHLSDGRRSALSWVGPRFDEGVDSVTLIVQTRSAPQAPEASDAGLDPLPGGAGNFGSVMSTLRRSSERDELELVRAHVARDEAAHWRVLLDRTLFAHVAVDTPAALEAPLPDLALDGIWPAPGAGLPQPPLLRRLPWVLAAALAYASLIAAKARAVQRAAALRRCRVRAVVGVSVAVRAAGAGLLWTAASCAVIWFDAPLLAALLLLCALALAAHRPPALEARLRGPGQWQPLDSGALAPVATAPLPGAWLDVGRPRGLLLLLAALGASTAVALRVFATSPYFGACLLLGSTALLPVFCTGRAAELPEPGLAQSRRFLARVLKALNGSPDLVLQPLGRLCTGASELDELRLALHPAQSLPGLIGMELALELRPVLTGQSAWPVLVIRVADGSPCQLALPRQLSWSRGRSAEERAALVRPKLPSAALSVELIRELLAAARAAPAPARSLNLSRRTRAGARATAA